MADVAVYSGAEVLAGGIMELLKPVVDELDERVIAVRY